MSANPIVVIPARMASTRLPDKPLADIGGAPMIVHVWRRAMEAQVGPVIVACAEPVIAEAVERAGGKAILTRPDHPSGSDRVHEAVERLDPQGAYNVVLNVQGDLPTLDPKLVRVVLGAMAEPDIDIATLAVEIRDAEERASSSVVKAVVSAAPGAKGGRALYFSRQPVPWGDGPLYHHIGLYGFRRAALRRFVSLPPSPLEQCEKLEQLRALENGMRIEVAFVDTVPLGVDTPADLARARTALAPGRSSPSN
ncbi:MAG: 3-deoxy-manno-octulosonate cytidylyltransferase [Alphaproteobacteria bacterium]